jgi:dihydrofolate reductase
MRKIIFLMHLSLDGYVAGPNGEMDWIRHEDDIAADSYSLHDATDAAIYGRVTYEMMNSYWPSVLDDPNNEDIAHARWYDQATKLVVSRSYATNAKNTVVIHDVAEIAAIKQQPGKDMWLLGSPATAQAMMQHNMIDEYRLNINPVILGQGKRLFNDPQDMRKLHLIDTIAFKGGVVGLRYVPVK